MAKAQQTGNAVRLYISKIKVDRAVQPREATDKTVVAEYAERIKVNDKLPPVVVFFDGTTYWLAEGFHRLAAYKTAGRTMIECILIDGTKEDAQWHALQSNKTHGLRRSIEDKQRAVQMALEHPRGKDMADRAIADLVGVSPTMVAKYRPKTESTVQVGQSKKRVGRDGRTIDTAKIGKKHKAKSVAKSVAKKTSEPPASAPVDDERADTGYGHFAEEGGGQQLVVQSKGDAKNAGNDSLTECSAEIIDQVADVITGMQAALNAFLRIDEVTNLPDKHRLTALLGMLETNLGEVALWAQRQRDLLDYEDEPDTAGADEEDEEWTA
jgi:ParB-like chromosome segregation protein Spo0J